MTATARTDYVSVPVSDGTAMNAYGDFEMVRAHISKLTREGFEADIDATFAWLAKEFLASYGALP